MEQESRDYLPIYRDNMTLEEAKEAIMEGKGWVMNKA